MAKSALFLVLLVNVCLRCSSLEAGSLELEYQHNVQSTQYDEAFLKCEVVTDLAIKQVAWYALKDSGFLTIYYYEPASSLDTALDERFNRSSTDGTSLSISPVLRTDEGRYKCHVEVWDPPAANSTLENFPSIPIEHDALMQLVVNIPPSSDVHLSSLMNGNNMSLTCKATDAKPSAEITWIKTTRDGEEIELSSARQTIAQNPEPLYDTTGHLYYVLSRNERAAKISCVVRHPETATVLFKNLTIVSPAIQNAVEIFLDRLGENVVFSSVLNQKLDDPDAASGLVKISADPGLQVTKNSSVTLTASAPDVFPTPNFLWWTGERAAFSGAELYISNLEEDAEYYVLAENPVGRVLLSVPLTVVDADATDNGNTASPGSDGDEKEPVAGAGLNGGLIAAIVIASLLACLLIGLAIWYCTCKNPPNEGIPNVRKPKKPIAKKVEESDPFMPTERALMRTTSTQTLEGKRSKKDGPPPQPAKSEDNILNRAPRNSGRKRTPPPEYATKERPMEKHLKEYDESASFVEDYGSRDGLETASSAENLHSAHEGDGDSRSEMSIPISEESGRRVREEVV